MESVSDDLKHHVVNRRRYRLLFAIEAFLETPMLVLAFVWAVLLIRDLTRELSSLEQGMITGIWIVFIVEFLIRFTLAPKKLRFLKRNILTILALFVPALRIFRVFRLVRLFRAARLAPGTMSFVRVVTSASRLGSEIQDIKGEDPTREMNVGILVAYSNPSTQDELKLLAERLVGPTKTELESASRMPWYFHVVEPERLGSDDPRRPSDFLPAASLQMAEGPFDIVVVLTDVAISSRKRALEPGLASPVSRIAVISARKLTMSPRGQPTRPLLSEPVVWNTSVLLLHMIGHMAGLPHSEKSGIMSKFQFQQEHPSSVPHFSKSEREELFSLAETLPERDYRKSSRLGAILFHILMSFRHPVSILRPLIRNKAVFLPLSLPSLSTAAVAPTFLLVFTAEIWDVGFNMSDVVAIGFAGTSLVLATFYLTQVLGLYFPRREKRLVTEHLAIANTVVFLSIFLAMVGLFAMVMTLVLVIEFWVFPEGLMNTWPTLDNNFITTADQIRLAVFISTIGLITGALAGGLESRTVIQHLALFEDTP